MSVSPSAGGAKEMPAHLRKKKRTPSLASPRWLNSKFQEHETALKHREQTVDLGSPNVQRRLKSNGFSEENLSPGGPKVPRAVEKAPFTLPDQRLVIIAEEIDRAIKLKRPPDPLAKLTAIDKILAEHEWSALAWFVQTLYRREVGRPARMRFDDAPRGLIEQESQREARWRLDLSDLEYVEKHLHLAGLEIMEMIAWQIFPDMREGKPPTEIDIGRAIVWQHGHHRPDMPPGKEQANGGYRGYLRCLAQLISEKKKDAETHRRRLRERKEFAQIEHRKQKAEALFR